jgi:hypothetical protein
MQIKKAYREHIKNRTPGPFVPANCKFPPFISRPHASSKLLKDYVRRKSYLSIPLFPLCIPPIPVHTDHPLKINDHIIDITYHPGSDDEDDLAADDIEQLVEDAISEIVEIDRDVDMDKGKGKAKAIDNANARKSVPLASKPAPFTPKPLPRPYTPLNNGKGLTGRPPSNRKKGKSLSISLSHTVTVTRLAPLTPLSHNCTARDLKKQAKKRAFEEGEEDDDGHDDDKDFTPPRSAKKPSYAKRRRTRQEAEAEEEAKEIEGDGDDDLLPLSTSASSRSPASASLFRPDISALLFDTDAEHPPSDAPDDDSVMEVDDPKNLDSEQSFYLFYLLNLYLIFSLSLTVSTITDDLSNNGACYRPVSRSSR